MLFRFDFLNSLLLLGAFGFQVSSDYFVDELNVNVVEGLDKVLLTRVSKIDFGHLIPLECLEDELCRLLKIRRVFDLFNRRWIIPRLSTEQFTQLSDPLPIEAPNELSERLQNLLLGHCLNTLLWHTALRWLL